MDLTVPCLDLSYWPLSKNLLSSHASTCSSIVTRLHPSYDGVSWGLTQVLERSLKELSIIPSVSEDGVAGLAQEPSNVTAVVIVVDRKSTHLPRGSLADVADASLRLVEGLVLLQGKAVGLEYPTAVSGPFLGFLEGSQAGSTPRTGRLERPGRRSAVLAGLQWSRHGYFFPHQQVSLFIRSFAVVGAAVALACKCSS